MLKLAALIFGSVFLIGGLTLFAISFESPNEQPCAAYRHDTGSESFKNCVEADSAQRVAIFTEQLAKFTAGLVVLTFALAAVGYWQGYLTRQSINLARDDFNATHRPWIPVIEVKVGEFGARWTDGNFIIGLQVSCKNSGNSPAQRISLVTAIFPFLSNDLVLGEMTKLQERHRNRTTSDIREFTMFPDDATLSLLETALIIGKGKLENLKDGLGDPAVEMVPVILGSIAYYFPFGTNPDPHYTPFVRHIWRTGLGREELVPFPLDGTDSDPSRIRLLSILNGGDAT